MFNNKGSKKGFTLIELLVVISIIGLLSSVVLASLNTARMKARNSIRIQILKQMKLALSLYYDKNGSFPPDRCYEDSSYGGTGSGVLGCDGTQQNGDWDINSGLKLLVPEFISVLPKDPVNTNTYKYSYEPEEKGICLQAKLEGVSTDQDDIGIVMGDPVTLPGSYTGGTLTILQTFPIGYQCIFDVQY